MFSDSMPRGVKGFNYYLKSSFLIPFLCDFSNQKSYYLYVNLESGTTGSVIIQVGVEDFLFFSHYTNTNSFTKNIRRCFTEIIVIVKRKKIILIIISSVAKKLDPVLVTSLRH